MRQRREKIYSRYLMKVFIARVKWGLILSGPSEETWIMVYYSAYQRMEREPFPTDSFLGQRLLLVC
jgi:hypothetical protein